jgi:ethanolamine utilization protein EutQ
LKVLISVNEVNKLAEKGKKVLFKSPETIITPAAKDKAEELGMSIEECCNSQETQNAEENQKQEEENVTNEAVSDSNEKPAVDPELIAKIVKNVLAGMNINTDSCDLQREIDPSGLCLIKGDSVVCEPFNTGNPNDKVGIKEILSTKESPNMGLGFMTMEESSFSWDMKYEEIDYIVEGTLEFTVDGKTYTGKAGDVFYIPKDTTVTFSTPDKTKFFFVVYPANWAELCGYKG